MVFASFFVYVNIERFTVIFSVVEPMWYCEHSSTQFSSSHYDETILFMSLWLSYIGSGKKARNLRGS